MNRKSNDTYSVEVINDGNFVRELGLGIADIYLASSDLSVLHLLNQMSSDFLVFVCNKAEATAGPSQGIAHNLSFFNLAPLLKVAREVFVIQLIIQTSDEDFFLYTTDQLALALKSFAVSVTTSRPIS
jgi:hypothetical protein